jgi:hypothetical protein
LTHLLRPNITQSPNSTFGIIAHNIPPLLKGVHEAKRPVQTNPNVSLARCSRSHNKISGGYISHDFLCVELHPEGLRPDATGAHGHLPVLWTLAIPEQIVMLMVRSHSVSGKLLFLANWKSCRKWTHTTGLPIRMSTSRTSKQFSLTDRCGAPSSASSSSLL